MSEIHETRLDRSLKNSAEPPGFSSLLDRLSLDNVRLAYRLYACFYDILFGRVCQPGRRSSVQLVNTEADQHILEVRVGTGPALPLYRGDTRIVGIDVS